MTFTVGQLIAGCMTAALVAVFCDLYFNKY